MKGLALLAFAAGVAAASFQAIAADAPAIPAGVKPLTGAEILKLLDGHTFEFTAYDEPLVGTTNWSSAKKTVSGSYVWKNTDKGNYEAEWFIEDDKNCTREKGKDPVCQTIYPYESGFMEVNADGEVHATSVPSN